MPKKYFLLGSDIPAGSDNKQSAQEINEVETHKGSYFVIGFTGWFLVSNVLLVISLMGMRAWSYTIGLGFISIWLSTIISIVVLAKKRIWCSAGILAAVIINIGTGLLLAHGFQNQAKVILIAATPIPFNFIVLLMSIWP